MRRICVRLGTPTVICKADPRVPRGDGGDRVPGRGEGGAGSRAGRRAGVRLKCPTRRCQTGRSSHPRKRPGAGAVRDRCPGFRAFPVAAGEALGFSERTYCRRLREGRLEAAEARAAAFLPRALERIEALFQDHRRTRVWLTTHNPRLGAVTAARLGGLEGFEEVLLVAEEAYYGFL